MAELQIQKERREWLMKLLDNYRRQKGLKLQDISITDQAGNEISHSYKSMLFTGKRRFTFWQAIQLCKALHIGIYFDGEWCYVADREFVDTHLKISEKTREEEMTYETKSNQMGDMLIQWTVRRNIEN